QSAVLVGSLQILGMFLIHVVGKMRLSVFISAQLHLQIAQTKGGVCQIVLEFEAMAIILLGFLILVYHFEQFAASIKVACHARLELAGFVHVLNGPVQFVALEAKVGTDVIGAAEFGIDCKRFIDVFESGIKILQLLVTFRSLEIGGGDIFI